MLKGASLVAGAAGAGVLLIYLLEAGPTAGIRPVSQSVLLGNSGVLNEIDSFRRAQSRLDRASNGSPRLGIKGMIAHNMAEGDGLLATEQEKRRVSQRAAHSSGSSVSTWQALRDADATITNAGLGNDESGLIGKLRSSDIIREMSATGKIPTAARDASLGGSLKEELKASQKQLGDMEAGSLGAKWASQNTGLEESALNTVSQGLSYGLSVKRLDPANGLQTGQLSVPDSQDADAIARKELRGVADGKLSDSATLVGMGQ